MVQCSNDIIFLEVHQMQRFVILILNFDFDDISYTSSTYLDKKYVTTNCEHMAHTISNAINETGDEAVIIDLDLKQDIVDLLYKKHCDMSLETWQTKALDNDIETFLKESDAALKRFEEWYADMEQVNQ